MLRAEDILRIEPEKIVEVALGDYKPYGFGVILQCSKIKPYTRSPVYWRLRHRLMQAGLWPPRYDVLIASDAYRLVPIARSSMDPIRCYEVPPSTLEDEEFRGHIREVCRLSLKRFNGVYYASVVGRLRQIMEETRHPGLTIHFYRYNGRWTRFDDLVRDFRQEYLKRVRTLF